MCSHGRRTLSLVTRSLTWFWPLLALVYGVGAVDLYPFESHAQLPRGNEEMETVDLTTPFVFFQQEYTQIAVNVTLNLLFTCTCLVSYTLVSYHYDYIKVAVQAIHGVNGSL